MKKHLYFLPLLLLPLFTSCSKPNFSKIKNVRDYVTSLSKIRDYTLDVDLKEGTQTISYEVIYNDKYFFHNEENDAYGYVLTKKNKVSYFDEYEGNLLPSSALKNSDDADIKSLWGLGLFPSFADLNLKAFSTAMDKDFAIKDKLTILNILKIIDIDAGIYLNFKSMKVSITDEHNLQFDFNFTTLTGSFIVKNIYESKHDDVVALQEKGSYIYSEDEKAICNGFDGDNYSELVLDDSGEMIGYTAFTERYYFTEYTDKYLSDYKEQEGSSMILSGFIGFNGDKIGNETYTGVYLVNMVEQAYMLTYYRIPNPDIPLALTYPKYLLALDNLQYFTFDATYLMNMTTYSPILRDFYKNYQLDTRLGSGYAPYMLGYNYMNEKDLSVTFSLIVSTPDGTFGSLNYYYVNFGTTSSPRMESILNQIEKK